MVEAGKTYENPETGTSIKIVEHWDDTDDRRFVFERTLPHNTGRLDPHFHQDCSQDWTAVSGELRMEVDGEERALRPGETVRLAPGAAHRDPWNAGEGAAVMRAEVEPVPEFFKAYTEAYVHRLVNDRLNKNDEFPLIQIFVLGTATDGRSFRTGIPVPAQRLVGRIAAPLGRLLGYRAAYD